LIHTMAERNTYRDRRRVEFAFRDTLSMGAGLMGRIVHLENALAQRGYPEHIRGQCVVQMRDTHLPANEIPLSLRVEAGRASVESAAHEGNHASVATADARTWAELYSGTISPRDARTLGHLDANDATVAFLAEALASDPWYVHRADWF
ncbi:MAG: sterol carrier protein domain-containing protein, partial [Ardenticatenaceae bacterium]